jgi:MoaA/NifB/PqqE/SkfB family radical SAM enzyme
MNYFEQISAGSEENILLLLGQQKDLVNETAKRALFKRNVEIINLELSYSCNRKCDYCPVSSSSRKDEQKMMSLDLLNKVCNELRSIRYENRISLNLYNEPLLDRELEDKISLIREHLPFAHIAFNTNGDKLTLKRLQKLSNAGCNSICVTIHPPPNKSLSSETILRRTRQIFKKLAYEPIEPFSLERLNFIQFRLQRVTLKIQ